jgi:penicillin-binding protein 2
MVQNEPVYDITVVPKQVKPLIRLSFVNCWVLIKKALINVWPRPGFIRPIPYLGFEKQLSAQQYASFQERLSEFPGFYTERSVRTYPDSIASHNFWVILARLQMPLSKAQAGIIVRAII